MTRSPHINIIGWIVIAVVGTLFAYSCKNKPLTDNSEIKPREIHENIQFHFDEIEVDGVEYLILEKDNNNPHEGFGFMAFRANKLIEKQDTLLAYMRTIMDLNTQIYARLNKQSIEESRRYADELFNRYLRLEQEEMSRLVQENYTNKLDTVRVEHNED